MDSNQNNLFSDIFRIMAIAVFFGAVAFYFETSGIRQNLLQTWVWKNDVGTNFDIFASTIMFTAVFGLLITLGLPRLLASAAGGVFFGVFTGTVASVAAALVGAALSYFFGRFTLSDIVERRLSGKFETWRNRFHDNAFWWVLYGRLFPFSHSTIMSLFCGTCNIPFLPYAAASLIGFIPLAIVFALYGSGGVTGNYLYIAIASILLIFSLLARKIIEYILFQLRIRQRGRDLKGNI